MPAVELFDSQELWQAIGPFVITGLVILIVGLVGSIFVLRMERGLFKDFMKIGFMFSLVFIAYIALQVTAKIWGS